VRRVTWEGESEEEREEGRERLRGDIQIFFEIFTGVVKLYLKHVTKDTYNQSNYLLAHLKINHGNIWELLNRVSLMSFYR